MAAPTWMSNGVGGWPPSGPSGSVHARLLGFVKTVLLRQLVPPNSLVCDLFCGRGIDTERWAEAGIGQYVGIDLASSALEDAREQWEKHDRPFPAEFCELDPCMVGLESHLQDHGLPADVVSCLAHLQDAFTSEEMVRRLLKNVEAVLKPGGFFFGTAPDSSTIWYKYQKAVQDAIKAGTFSLRAHGTLPSVRTEMYKITFDDERFTPFGSSYHMRFTDDGLPAQPQLLVHFPTFIGLAKEVGLECVEIQNLLEFYDDHSGPFADVFRSCCESLVDLKGNPLLDAKGRLAGHALDVLSLFTTFVFKKGGSTMLNDEVAASLEPSFETPHPNPKTEADVSSLQSEPPSTTEEEGGREQRIKVEGRNLLASLVSLTSNARLEGSQQDFVRPRVSDAHVAESLKEELQDGRTQPQGERDGDQEEKRPDVVMQEASYERDRDEERPSAAVLDNNFEDHLHGSAKNDPRTLSDAPSRSLLQPATTGDDGHSTEAMHELGVDTYLTTLGSRELSKSDPKTSMTEAEELQNPPSPELRMPEGSSTIGPPTFLEPVQGIVIDAGHKGLQPPPVDNCGSALPEDRMVESLDERSGVHKLQLEPPSAKYSPKPLSPREKDGPRMAAAETGEGEKQSGAGPLAPPPSPPSPLPSGGADHHRSPKHYSRRAHDESSRSESRQDSSPGDHSSKHYRRRSHDDRNGVKRLESQQQQQQPEQQQQLPASAADHNNSKRHQRRIHDTLQDQHHNYNNKRRDVPHESPKPAADRTPRQYERRRMMRESHTERPRAVEQQQRQSPSADHPSKHYMRRITHANTEQSHGSRSAQSREEQQQGNRVQSNNGDRSNWMGGNRSSASQVESHRILQASSQTGRSTRIKFKRYPPGNRGNLKRRTLNADEDISTR